MPIRSHLPYLSVLILGAVFLMLSCGSRTRPDQLTVQLPEHFTGSTLRLSACVATAPADAVTVDEQGIGKTSLCPGPDRGVEIEVLGGDRRYRLLSRDVRITRAGDGIASSIEAQLPR